MGVALRSARGIQERKRQNTGKDEKGKNQKRNERKERNQDRAP